MADLRLGVRAAIVDGTLVDGDVRVVDGRVAEVGLPPRGQALAVPGFVDLQLNGYAGVDFNGEPADRWAPALEALAADGVSHAVVNLITAPADDIVNRTQAVAQARATTAGGAMLLGAHLEGPFLSESRRGTHPKEHLLAPDLDLLHRLLAAGPVVGLTIAPELPGAVELVRYAVRQGLLVALGHSNATESEAGAGFDAGARTVTHLFNGMSAPTARDAGLAGVALARRDVAIQLICDRVHLGDATTRLAFAAAPGRWVLVTDATAAAGRPAGRYRLAGLDVVVAGGAVRLADGDTLAGSALRLPAALRNAVDLGVGLVDAVNALTTRPARLVGVGGYARLRPGDVADLVVLDEDLEVAGRWLAGSPL